MDRVVDLRSPKPTRAKHAKNDTVSSPRVGNYNNSKKCRIRLNVGGIYFEILRTNLMRFPDTLLGGDRKEVFYDEEKQEYFFDRDPVTFKYVLDFYRTGKFHISTPDCMESIRDELAFFGIPEAFVSECCCEHISFENKEEDETLCSHKDQPHDHDGRRKLYKFLTEYDSSLLATSFSYFFVIVVVINICLIVSETLECDNFNKCGEHYVTLYFIVDSFCVAVFTFEYFARLFSCPNRIEFMKEYSNVVDLVGILPYYIGIVERIIDTRSDALLSVITTLRIFRIFRVIKLARHSEQFQNLLHSIAQAGGELGGILFSFLALMVVFSSIIYFVEDGGAENPDGFTSIPSAFWYTLVTMTTLGYGDMYPTTTIGKLIGSACALAGVVLLALPVPIIEEKLKDNNRKLNRRKESKMMTVTDKLTKRLAVSLASLKSFQRRLRPATSQSSMAVEVSYDETTTETKRSNDDLSIDESSSGDETIKASCNEIPNIHPVDVHYTPPCNTTNHYTSSPQSYLGSYEQLYESMNFNSSDVGSKSGDKVELQTINADSVFKPRALIRQDSLDEPLSESTGTNSETADHASDHQRREQEDKILRGLISTI